MEFTLRIPRYNDAEYLHGTMVEFGRYEVRYLPPEGSDEPTCSMTITSEADRNQMDGFFDKFLRYEGYPPSKSQSVVCEKHWDGFWEDANDDEVLDNK